MWTGERLPMGNVGLLSLKDGSTEEIKTFDAHDGQGLSTARTA